MRGIIKIYRKIVSFNNSNLKICITVRLVEENFKINEISEETIISIEYDLTRI